MRATCDAAEPLRALGVALELGGHDPRTLGDADLIVVSPGVPLRQPAFELAAARGVETIGEIELASRWLSGRVIAVTGTKGKSTTTTVDRPDARGRRPPRARRRQHRRAAVGAGGRVHARDACTSSRSAASSWRRPRPSGRGSPCGSTWPTTTWIATPTWRNTRAAKARIFANQGPDDWAVINADDPAVVRWSRGIAARTVAFSPSARATDGLHGRRRVDRAPHRRRSSDRLVPVAAVELAGRAHAGQRGGRGGGRGDGRRRRATAMTQRAARLPRARARHGAGGHQGRRPVRERLEGDQRRGRPPVDRELRGAASWRSSADASRAATCGRCASRWRRAAERWWRIGEAAPLVADALAGVVPVLTAGSMREAVALAYPGGAARRRGAAGAGVRQLRLVRGLRRARARVQAGGGAAVGRTRFGCG